MLPKQYFVGADLQHDVNIHMVFEVAAEFYDVAMVQALVDFYFAHKFLLGTRLG